jgi:hypothetical protein
MSSDGSDKPLDTDEPVNINPRWSVVEKLDLDHRIDFEQYSRSPADVLSTDQERRPPA